MSRYDWERGTIRIPASEYPKFRKAIIEEWNNEQNKNFEEAKTVLKAVKERLKGKRGEVDYVEEIYKYLWDKGFTDNRIIPIAKLICKKGRYELNAPMKKDLEIFPISQSVKIEINEVYIGLDNDSKTLTYSVRENNHACEDAHNLNIIKKMFNLLSRIQWTRGTGGEIEGNDEYNIEAGGGSYTKYVYRSK